MSTTARVTIAGLALVVLVAAFLVLRPGEELEPATTDEGTQAPAEPVGGATDAPPAAEREPAVPTVRTRGSRPVGGVQEIEVRRGERVRFAVTADAADHVHVHGYDLMRDIGPGQAARFSFPATLEGVFEVELEDAGQQVIELEVRP